MITIYGTTTCKWCKAAVSLVEARGLQHDYRLIDENEQFYAELKTLKPDTKTVPQIWWDNRYIGGYTDLTTEIENTSGGFGDGKF
jgi:glutaredoxin 1